MKICSYDEAYDIFDAYEIGWCYKCKCDKNCPMKNKINKRVDHQTEKGGANNEISIC